MATATANLGLRLPDDIAPNDDSVDVTLDISNSMVTLDTVIGNADSDPSSIHQRLLDLEARRLLVIKQTQEIISSDTTLSNDAELVIPVEANIRYKFEAYIGYQSSAVADLKFDWTGPSGWLMRGIHMASEQSDDVNAFGDTVSFPESTPASGGTGGAADALAFSGTVIVGGTAGNFRFRWAQNTSEATNTAVNAGSWISLEKDI